MVSAVFSVSSPSIAAILYPNKVVTLLLDCFSGMVLEESQLENQTGVFVSDYSFLDKEDPIVSAVLEDKELKYIVTKHTVYLHFCPHS